MAKTYSASMLKVLEGLDAVRMRPGMYIGSTGSRGLHHLLWEIVDNAIDEVANGYARSISVELHKDGSASVEDDGRGVPVDIHPELGITAACRRKVRSSELCVFRRSAWRWRVGRQCAEQVDGRRQLHRRRTLPHAL